MKIKLLIIFLFLFTSQVFAEVKEVDNDEIIALMQSGVPIIDIRRADEWHDTGIIKQSELLTFFDKQGNHDIEKWMSELKKVANTSDAVIIICRSGGRSRVVANLLDQEANYSNVYDATNGILSWINSKNKTVKPDLSYKNK